jgi:Caspase domain
MDRRALIIVNPGEVGADNYCEGVYADSRIYSRFLRSPQGGLWKEGEIRILDRPEVSEVRNEINYIRQVDYSFAAFAGHGFHAQDSDSTILELKRGANLDSSELKRGAPKHTMIIDCCRKVEDFVLLREMKKAARSVPSLNALKCRRFYDQEIAECSPGFIALYGCSIDEEAGERSDSGGYYSSSLIRSAENWLETKLDLDTQHYYSVLSVPGAHSAAVGKVTSLSIRRQNPVIERSSREGPYFPFCIAA